MTANPEGRRRARVQTAAYYATFVALGLAMASLGPTLTGLAENTGSSLSQIGILFTVRSLGALAGSLLGSRLYDRVAGHPVAAGMLLVMAAALALAPTVPLLWLLCVVMFAYGFGEVTVDLGGNTMLVWVHGARVPAYMNALHFFFGVGAFLSPLIVAQAVLATGDITWAYWILALLLLPVSGWLLRLPSPSRPGPAPDGARGQARGEAPPADRVLVGLFIVAFFLYVGAEISYGGWVYSYARVSGLAGQAGAAYLNSAFFGAYTFGRLLSIPIVARVRPRTVLLADLSGAVLSLGLIALLPASRAALWAGTVALGLSIASIFPTLISMAGRHLVLTGRISGLFFAGGTLGAMGIPWLAGQLLAGIEPRAVIVLLLVELALDMAVVGALVLYVDRRLPGTLSGDGDVARGIDEEMA